MKKKASGKMRWSSFLSQASSLENAVREACQAVTASLYGVSSATGGSRLVDFAAVFISESWRARYKDLPALLQPYLSAKVLIGCTAGGVIGGAQEVEHHPAVSISAALLPDVTLYPFYVRDELLPDLDAGPEAWRNIVGIPEGENPGFILMADPFSFRIETFVTGLDYAFPNSPKVGGLASGARSAGENLLYLNTRGFSSGLVGIGFTGNLTVDTVVAQGCRPIGRPMTVTACDRNMLLEVDHEAPVGILQNLLPTLSERDRQLVAHSLFLGVQTESFNSSSAGCFLIRNLMGADPHRGVLAVNQVLRTGQTVRFYVRDSQASAENLETTLRDYEGKSGRNKPKGALLFSCLGRGEGLYGTSNHDSRLFTSLVGQIPLGGFFCNGEIGPVGAVTYVHGYTSCFGLFREAPSGQKSGQIRIS